MIPGCCQHRAPRQSNSQLPYLYWVWWYP